MRSKEDREAVIASACRTPIGTFGGALRDMLTGDLAQLVIEESLKRANISKDKVDELVFGQVVARTDENCLVSRLGALKAGIPDTVPAHTVTRGCGSGMQALIDATRTIWVGDADVVVAGGVENMSAMPYYCKDVRWGKRLQHSQMIDSCWDVLHDPYTGLIMGMTAENIAERFGITREEQDKYAAESQRKANTAIGEGKFKEEIVPVEIKTRKGVKVFDTDEYPMPDSTFEKLSTLRPAFKKDGGSVTAGNASGLNDGAAALVMMSKQKAEEEGIKPLARVIEYSYVGVDPAIMGIGPVPAVNKVLKKAGMTIDQIEIFELNEAFAAQAVYCVKELGMDPDIVNIYGGGVALGHPVGCSGARIVVTLMSALKDRGKKTGIATLCIGGGQGTAMLIELL